MRTLSEQRCHGGTIGFYAHPSAALGGLDARFGLFLPAGAAAPCPAPYALAGLTCDEQTFAAKSGALRHAAEHRLAMVFPDTSPRGAGIPGEDADWDFGLDAGYYLDATEPPWNAHYRTDSHVATELPALVEATWPVSDRRGITGHSMGGHGALTLAPRDPSRWHSVSAIAPICHPAIVPWARKPSPASSAPTAPSGPLTTPPCCCVLATATRTRSWSTRARPISSCPSSSDPRPWRPPPRPPANPCSSAATPATIIPTGSSRA